MPEAYAATRVLLERCPDLTAIFAVSDVMAMGAVRALADLGRQVPRDISVVGYDGITAGQYFLPRLTTVRQDIQQLAERGVDALLRSILRRSPSVHGLVPFQLVEGESVARIG
jgi:LacI family transcriptional regulator